ncbi:MAG: hypothetical protein M3Z05_14805 [Gemmatimonadota bacterium]|nr:hypothetical protein [Gemmatimonadota bacterium]
MLPDLVGKTIANVVMKEGTGPFAQLFLVFTDDTYYEFYSTESISGGGRLYSGGTPAVLASGKPNEVVLFKC